MMAYNKTNTDWEKLSPEALQQLLDGLVVAVRGKRLLSWPLSAARSPIDFAECATGGRYQRAEHLDLLNEKLVQVANGEIKRLIVAMPPRHGKSWLVSRFFPAWFVGTNPDKRVIFAAYESDFAARWGRSARDLILEHGPFFKVQINPESSSAARWDLHGHEGGMYSVGVGGPITGKGADVLLIDDPIKNSEEAHSASQREKLWQWFQSVAFTRLEPNAAIVLTMTRWHEDDLIGRLLAGNDEQWEVLRLPAIAEEDDPVGRQAGEPLWPERYDLDELRSIQRTVGSYTWSALYQQSPVPVGGNIIQRHWFRYWRAKERSFPVVGMRLADGLRFESHAVELPENLDSITQSWDLSFKDSATSDYVVGQVWGKLKADRYLLDQVRGRMDFPKTVACIRQLTGKWPTARRILVEAKANGEALIASLKHEIGGILPINPTADKVARTHAITAELESGNVYIPHPQAEPWVQGFIEECVSFPSAKHDDQVDAMTQALNNIRSYGEVPTVSPVVFWTPSPFSIR